MDDLRDMYVDEDEDEGIDEFGSATATPNEAMSAANVFSIDDDRTELRWASGMAAKALGDPVNESKEEDVSDDEVLDYVDENNGISRSSNDCDDEEDRPLRKGKTMTSFAVGCGKEAHLEQDNCSSQMNLTTLSRTNSAAKKPKKKSRSTSVWLKSTRKAKKKNTSTPIPIEDTVLIAPIPKINDKNDDLPDMKICLSRVYKDDKVELSEDRLSAESVKGYRMVRATRGVMEGAWYFEIKVVKLGETGHTRLGWSTDKGDLHAPVGYDGNSYGYRDIDGCKIHKALRENYGLEGYVEGDVIGFYINLPEGNSYAPKPPKFVWYKGQKYVCVLDPKDDPPKLIPGSEIMFFKNGICQGVAFEGLFGGRYFPAASLYTLPNQPKCTVTLNFGPDFDFFPEDFDGRPIPNPMIEVPYHVPEGREENGTMWDTSHIRFSNVAKTNMLKSEDVGVIENE